MKYLLLASLLSTAAIAAPAFGFGQKGNGNTGTGKAQGQGQTQSSQNQGGKQSGNTATPSASDLASAVSEWQADTSKVSNFLNIGKGITDDTQFKQAATIALNAEKDELNHKAVIDQALGTNANVQAANSTLVTGGSFQDVVNRLQTMSTQGVSAVGQIDLINDNRCVNVLPNIDEYYAATGSNSKSIRPKVCDATGVTGGAQGDGPTKPGDKPGTPQQAFASAGVNPNGNGNGNGNAQQQSGQAQSSQQSGTGRKGAAKAGGRRFGIRD